MMRDFYSLIEHADICNKANIAGKWSIIQLQPDFAHGELLNIGVIFENKQEFSFKLLDTFHKTLKLYGGNAVDEMQFIVKAVKAVLSQQQDISAFPYIHVSTPKYASGETANSIIEHLYNSNITLSGLTHSKQRNKRKIFLNNTTIRNDAFTKIKKSSGITASKIIATDDELLFNDNKTLVALDVPLQTVDQLGTVISADFTTINNVERSLFKGFIDLTTATAITSKSSAAFFLCRGDYHKQDKDNNKIENVIDIFEWKLSKQNIKTIITSNPDSIADDIMDWAHV